MRLPLLLAAALLVGLFAGCSTPQSTVTSTSTTQPTASVSPRPTTLAAPTVLPDMDLGQGDGEPNIAVAPDGTLYITPINHVYRSVDAGKTWKDLGTTQTDGHGDGDIAVDATGRLHWLGLFGKGGAIPYQHSDDKGDSFSSSIDLSSPDNKTTDGTGSDREWIDAAPGGWLYTIWRDGKDGVAFRSSADNGASWNKQVSIGPDALTGPVVHGPRDGDVYVPMTTSDASGPGTPVGSASSSFRIELGVSHDHGQHWKLLPVVTPPQFPTMEPVVDEGTAIFPVAAVDANGTVYVAWSSEQTVAAGQALPKHESRYAVYLMHSPTGEGNWSAPVMVSDPMKAAILPFLAAGRGGSLAIVWYESTVGVPNESIPDLWNVRLWESVDADAAQPKSASVLLNSAPSHIGSVCTTGGACLFTAGDRSLLDYFEVALDTHGQPVVAWASSAGGTAVGVAAQGTHVHFGGVATGTALV